MISIIVLSSDGYSDCWNPFFKLLSENFPEASRFEILLSTNNKEFSYPDLQITSLQNGMDSSWSERLLKSLDRSSHEIVLVVIEDFFLRSKMDSNVFHELVKLIKEKDEIDHIRLRYKKEKFRLKKSNFNLLDQIDNRTQHRFLYLPGLWKKQVLKKYVVGFENPFLAEKMGNLRSYIRKDGFYSVSAEFVEKHGQVYDCYGSGAIYKGKWNTWVKPFIEKKNIELDLSIRGEVSPDYQNISRRNTKMSLMKDPGPLIRSYFSIIKLYIMYKIGIVK